MVHVWNQWITDCECDINSRWLAASRVWQASFSAYSGSEPGEPQWYNIKCRLNLNSEYEDLYMVAVQWYGDQYIRLWDVSAALQWLFYARQVVHTHVPLCRVSWSCVIWYWPNGGDAWWKVMVDYYWVYDWGISIADLLEIEINSTTLWDIALDSHLNAVLYMANDVNGMMLWLLCYCCNGSPDFSM